MSVNSIFAQAIKTGNSVITVTADGVEYVAEAIPFASPTADAWKCYATAQCDRVEKEIYVGREGRQPVLVRVDRCERIVNALTYVSTALLISVLVAAGSLLWQAVVQHAAGK